MFDGKGVRQCYSARLPRPPKLTIKLNVSVMLREAYHYQPDPNDVLGILHADCSQSSAIPQLLLR